MTEHRYDPHRALLRVLARALYPYGAGSLAIRSEFLRAVWKTSPEHLRARVLADLAQECRPDAELTSPYAQQLRTEARTHALDRKCTASRFEVDPPTIYSDPLELERQLLAALELMAAQRNPVTL